MKKKLHLGAGHQIMEGWINHDLVHLDGIDIVHDLNEFPWPWSDGEFEEVLMKDVLEHLPNTIKVMEELYRICKKGAKLHIAVPFWNSYEAITDPTHTSQFNEFSFDFFDPSKSRCQNRPYYSSARFEIKRLGFGISFFRPYISLPILSRYFVIHNRLLKWFLGFLASIFCNIITGLEVYLEKK